MTMPTIYNSNDLPQILSRIVVEPGIRHKSSEKHKIWVTLPEGFQFYEYNGSRMRSWDFASKKSADRAIPFICMTVASRMASCFLDNQPVNCGSSRERSCPSIITDSKAASNG
jgi:hypothetical protein